MTYRKVCYQCFNAVKSIIAPSLEYHGDIYENCLWKFCTGGGAWLDLGCGARLLSPWSRYDEHELTGRYGCFVGIDYDMDSLRRNGTMASLVRGDISHLPFHDETFDVVTANMVFEHLDKPDEQLAEIHRILKRGGLLILATPNANGYVVAMARLFSDGIKKFLARTIEGRTEKDVFPTHYRMNTCKTITETAINYFNIVRVWPIISYPKFIIFPPLMLLEMLLLRVLMRKIFRNFRSNIVAVMLKSMPGPEYIRPDMARYFH